jgi:D-amino-acid oxidase
VPDVVVVGAGANGLACAITLLERGCRVAVWTRDDPADTVSAVAGAIWYPFLAEPRDRVLGWSAVTFRRLAALAADPATGVHLQPVLEVFDRADPDVWWESAVDAVQRLPRDQVPSPWAAAILTTVPVCDTTIHLPWLQQEVRRRGGAIERRTVRDFAEAFAHAPAVVNCTGLGAAALCGDGELLPVRGQIVVVEPVPLPHALMDDTTERPVYALPRRRDLVLGGTAQRGDTRTSPDDADTAVILASLQQHLPALRGARVRDVRVGLRPWRRTVRLELEHLPGGRRLVHDYGHGGSGYTLSWGCAAEVARLLGDGLLLPP